MDTRGDLSQEAIYNSFKETFGQRGLADLIQREGANRKTATDTANFMRNYWERISGRTQRPGNRFFEPMLEALINKPANLAPTGDYTAIDTVPFIGGRDALERLLAIDGRFTPILKTTSREFFRVGSYMASIQTGVSVFLLVDGTYYTGYLGETDIPIPDV